MTQLLAVGCPHCLSAVAVSADLFGQPAACPRCGGGFLAPDGPSHAAPLRPVAGPATPAAPGRETVTAVPAVMPGAAGTPVAATPSPRPLADAAGRSPRLSRRNTRLIRTLVMSCGALAILIVIGILASRKARTRR